MNVKALMQYFDGDVTSNRHGLYCMHVAACGILDMKIYEEIVIYDRSEQSISRNAHSRHRGIVRDNNLGYLSGTIGTHLIPCLLFSRRHRDSSCALDGTERYSICSRCINCGGSYGYSIVEHWRGCRGFAQQFFQCVAFLSISHT